MTRASSGSSLFDDSRMDKTLLLNLELKRNERRRNLRYRNSATWDSENVKQNQNNQSQKEPIKKVEKTVDQYAKDLEQWLKKMKCTGVTGVRLESFSDINVGILAEDVDPFSPSLEPYPNLWKEKHTYKGYKDELGRPKGRAVVEMENGDIVSGLFHEGLRHGECRTETSRLNLSHMVGNYVKDQLHGKAKLYFNDGNWLEGFFCRGILHGFVRNFDEKGRLKSIANYKNGVPNGFAWRVIRGGGVIVGRVDSKGCLTGHRIAYLYPDFKTAFVGTFVDGCLEEAQAAKLRSVVDDRGIKIPYFTEPYGPTYKRDVSNFDHVTNDPLLPDPYESSMVNIKVSKVEGAHDGLFVQNDVEPNTILAFYNGKKLTTLEMHDAPTWDENSYRIFDPTRKCGTIDIPKKFIDFANYKASLAHKTNHSFMPNAEFVVFDHPRFGLVPCVLATLDIKRGEEVFVHYGYELDDCPDWYEAAWQLGDYPVPETFTEWSYNVDEKKGIAIEAFI